LDEATSSVDAKSIEKIYSSLWKFARGITTIIISHNLPILKKTDRIFVLKNGEIVEQGKFKDLLKQKGEFYRLYLAGELE